MQDVVGGYCPVQGFGQVGDVFWYFRARGERWELMVGPEDSELDGYVSDSVWTASGFWGEAYDAGWMPHATAAGLIWGSLRRYLAGEEDWQAPDDIGWEEYGIHQMEVDEDKLSGLLAMARPELRDCAACGAPAVSVQVSGAYALCKACEEQAKAELEEG